ncbi:MAG: SCO family protein [Balneolaceae bacterium]|nr:SCO family protein [Balneolaceae bacterium]
MKRLSLIAIFVLSSFTLHAQHNHGADATLKAGEISGHSLYHLDADFTDQRNKSLKLSSFKGQPVIVVMFYGNCTQVCPILIRDTWRLYNAVDEILRPSVKVLAVSFDTENDTPEVLKAYAEYEQLNIDGWHFATSEPTNVRSLAMMLGVQYAKKSDGEFAHSNLVSVLDTEGKIAKRIEGLNQPMEEAAHHIEQMLTKNVEQ